jgi:hypothetical protein
LIFYHRHLYFWVPPLFIHIEFGYEPGKSNKKEVKLHQTSLWKRRVDNGL